MMVINVTNNMMCKRGQAKFLRFMSLLSLIVGAY